MKFIYGFLFAILTVFIMGAAVTGQRFNSTIMGGDESFFADVFLEGIVKRLQVNASGVVGTLPGEISKFSLIFFENGGSSNLRVDGSSTPVIFKAQPQTATEDALISAIRCFGGGSSLKYELFLVYSIGRQPVHINEPH